MSSLQLLKKFRLKAAPQTFYRLFRKFTCVTDQNVTDNFEAVKNNLERRNFKGNLSEVQSIINEIKKCDELQKSTLTKRLQKISLSWPNRTHPDVLMLENNRLIKTVNEKPKFGFKPLELHEISKHLDCLETAHIGVLMGPQSYYLKNCLVDLEQALITSTIEDLIDNHDFELISVPDLLHRDIIEACGMDTKSERNQVYKIAKENGKEADVCLSGTAEIALAGMYADKILNSGDLPIKLAAVSRCYRAETSNLKKEKGIFRVHEFTKVEMFAITANESNDESSDMLEKFMNIQINMNSDLGLHFKVLDMAPFELGAPAYRKYDIESWMPGRQMYGEISSVSNCTDYQSKRLNIRYKDNDGNIKYVHTINGTACAIPRMLITIMESYQQKNRTVKVPAKLQKYVQTDILKPPINKLNVFRVKS